jgi:hypothetical protein
MGLYTSLELLVRVHLAVPDRARYTCVEATSCYWFTLLRQEPKLPTQKQLARELQSHSSKQ